MSPKPPQQLELPGMEEESPTNLELDTRDIILLSHLAETGRDLLRRHLLANQVPTAEVFNVKHVVTRADRLIERLQGYLKNAVDKPEH